MTTEGYEFTLAPAQTALLIVDVQNDFCHKEGAFAQAGLDVGPCAAIITQIRKLGAIAKEAGSRVIFTRTVNPPDAGLGTRHRILPKRDRQVMRRSVCVEGSWGAQIAAELTSFLERDWVIDKTEYSAFYGTDLAEKLTADGIDTLVVTGVTTNVCIDSTIRDAYFRGLDIVVPENGVASFESHLHAATLENVDLLFGVVVDTSRVAELLQAMSANP